MVISSSNSNDPQTVRRVFGRCYMTADEFSATLLKHPNSIRYYAFAVHDKDVYDSDGENHKAGDFKQAHIHFCLFLQYPIRPKFVGNWFKNDHSVNVDVSAMRDVPSAFAYLTHKNNPEKYQYSDDIVVCNNFSAFMPEKEFVKCDSLTQAVFDLVGGASIKTLVSRYGRDFIIHYYEVKSVAGLIQSELSLKEVSSND